MPPSPREAINRPSTSGRLPNDEPCDVAPPVAAQRWPAGDPGKGPRHPADFYLAEYYREVRDFALGLAARGFRRGDKLAVIGDNRPRLYWAQLAA